MCRIFFLLLGLKFRGTVWVGSEVIVWGRSAQGSVPWDALGVPCNPFLSHPSPRAVKPLEHELRPKGLGLGAAQAPLPFSPLGIEPPEEGNGEESLGLAARGSVLVQAGPHRGLYGKVSVHPDAVFYPRTEPRWG